MTTTTDRPVISRAQAATILAALGFRVHTEGLLEQALRVFQESCRLVPQLEIDNRVGKYTTAALLLAEARRRAGMGTISEHFSYAEFQCKCRGKHSGCRGVVVLGALVDGLEKLRAAHYRGGLVITSGYRCVRHNAAVGGVGTSQHLFGGAADVAPVATTKQVRALGVFGGIGYKKATGRVQHVDARQCSPANPEGGTIAVPNTWPYS